MLKKLLLLSLLSTILLLQGCPSAVQKYRDPDLSLGCSVVEADVKLGWANQEGAAEVCKLKCSKDLPPNYRVSYNNARSGCAVEVDTNVEQ